MWKAIRDLLGSPMWLILLLSGIFALLVGSLAHTDIRGTNIAIDSPSRYIVEAIGGILIVAALVVAFISTIANIRTERNAAVIRAQQSAAGTQRLPIEQLHITEVQITGDGPKAQVSGLVAPAKAGANVYLLREDLSGRSAGKYSLAPGHATTDNHGHWKHSAALWPGGPFRIFAVVTTDEYEDLFRFYRYVFEAMLKENQKTQPSSTAVPGWPNLDMLPKTRVFDQRDVDLAH